MPTIKNHHQLSATDPTRPRSRLRLREDKIGHVPLLQTPFASNSTVAHSWSAPPPTTLTIFSCRGCCSRSLITPRAPFFQDSGDVISTDKGTAVVKTVEGVPRLVKWPAAGCVPACRSWTSASPRISSVEGEGATDFLPITSQTTSGDTRSKNGDWSEVARWAQSFSMSAREGAIVRRGQR